MPRIHEDHQRVSLPPRSPRAVAVQGALGPGLSDGCEDLAGGKDLGLLYTRPEDRPLRGPFSTGCWSENTQCYEAFMQGFRSDQAVDVLLQQRCVPAKLLRQVHAANGYALAVFSDGTVLTAGAPASMDDVGQLDVATETGVVQVATDVTSVLALKADGTFTTHGRPFAWWYNSGGQVVWEDPYLAAFDHWGSDVVQVFSAPLDRFAYVGLRAGGGLYVAQAEGATLHTAVGGWTDVVHLALGGWDTRIVACTSAGSVLYSGSTPAAACAQVSGFSGIVQVAVCANTTIGLAGDGSVVWTGTDSVVTNDLAGWPDDITAIAANGNYTVLGLRADGSVVAAGEAPQTSGTRVEDWSGVVQLHAGGCSTGRTSCLAFACGTEAQAGWVASIQSSFDYCF